jgi:hypothetical protein
MHLFPRTGIAYKPVKPHASAVQVCEEPPPLVHVCASTFSRGGGEVAKAFEPNQNFQGQQQWTMVLALQLATAPAGTPSPPFYILHSPYERYY